MSRYAVKVVTQNSEHSSLLNPSRPRRFVASLGRRVAALFAVLSIAMVGLLGTVASATPASANFGDMLADITCRTGVVGLAIEDRASTLSPTTGNGKTQAIPTPYEKYGLSGLTYSQWIGFDTGAKLDRDDGKGSLQGTRSIVAELGGDARKAGLYQWEEAVRDNYDSRPGLWNVKESCGDAWATGGTSVANGLLWVSKLLVFVSGQAFQVATEVGSSAFSWLEEPLSAVVTALKDRLYFNYLAPMTMIAALWIGYVGMVKRQSTQAASGLLWVLAAIIASVAMMTNPMALSKAVSGAVGGVSQQIVSSVTSVSPDENMCSMATASSAKNAKPQEGGMGGTENNSEARNSVRAFQCNLWYSFAYTPWVMGQFGQTPQELSADKGKNSFAKRSTDSSGNIAYAEDGFVLDVLDDQSGKPLTIRPVVMGEKRAPETDQNWALYLLDHKSNWDEAPESQKILKARGQMAVYANQLGADNYNSDFRGDDSGNRFAVATLSAIGALMATLMTVLVSLHILILDLGIILWVALLPIFSIVALHPGAGRRAATRFLATLVGFGILRIALSAVLAVSVLVMSIVMASAMSMGWLVAMILTCAVAALGIMAHSKVASALRGTSYLGVQPYAVGGDKFARSAKGAVGGSILGAGKALMGDRAGAAQSFKSAGRKVMTDAAARAGGGSGGGAGPAPAANPTLPDDRNDDLKVSKQASEQTNDGGAGQQPSQAFDAHTDASERIQETRSEGADTETTAFTSGAGAAPISEPEAEADSEPLGKDKTRQEVGGAGAAPATPVSRYEARDRRSVANREAARIKENLKREGYRPRTVTLATVLAATAQGAYVGARTGNALSGVKASSRVVAERRQQILAANAQAMSRVTRAEASHMKEQDRRKKREDGRAAKAPAAVPAAVPEFTDNQQPRSTAPSRAATSAPALDSMPAKPQSVPRPAAPVPAPAPKVDRTTAPASEAVVKPQKAAPKLPEKAEAPQVAPAVTGRATAPASEVVVKPQKAAPKLPEKAEAPQAAPAVTGRATVKPSRPQHPAKPAARRQVSLPVIENQMELPGLALPESKGAGRGDS